MDNELFSIQAMVCGHSNRCCAAVASLHSTTQASVQQTHCSNSGTLCGCAARRGMMNGSAVCCFTNTETNMLALNCISSTSQAGTALVDQHIVRRCCFCIHGVLVMRSMPRSHSIDCVGCVLHHTLSHVQTELTKRAALPRAGSASSTLQAALPPQPLAV